MEFDEGEGYMSQARLIPLCRGDNVATVGALCRHWAFKVLRRGTALISNSRGVRVVCGFGGYNGGFLPITVLDVPVAMRRQPGYTVTLKQKHKPGFSQGQKRANDSKWKTTQSEHYGK